MLQAQRFQRLISTNSSTSVPGLAELTSNVKVCVPFWNSVCNDESKRLWLPTATASAGSVSNLSSGCWTNMTPKSWFSIRHRQTPLSVSQKTSWQSSQCSLLAHTVCESTNEHLRKSSMAKEIYPNTMQKKDVQVKSTVNARLLLQ